MRIEFSHMRICPKAFRNCSVASCDKPAVGRSLCHKHYKRAQRNGMLPPRKLRERMKAQSFSVPESLESAIQQRARITGESYSSIIRKSLEQYLSHAVE